EPGLAPANRVAALVVDDIEENRDVLARMLRIMGVEVSEARHGAEALECLREKPVDVVFMDIRMPVMDGMQSLRHMRAERSDAMPVCIAVTASGFRHERERCLAEGFDDFIAKPYLFETVRACLRHNLEVAV